MPLAKMVLATSVALATLLAAEAASAQPLPRAVTEAYDAQTTRGLEAYDSQANPNYDFGPLVPVRPGDVIGDGNSVIGRDPSPFIRDQILRDYDSGSPD